MTLYFVKWTMDIEAGSPEEAAELARGHQTRDFTTATVFEVREFGSSDDTFEEIDTLDVPK